MREIKYRGWNPLHKKWLYGSHIINRRLSFIAPDEFAEGKSWMDYEVDPCSVGQFTGLYDMNGREIYEGDICALNYPSGRQYMSVEWDKEGVHFGFRFKGDDHIGCSDAFQNWIAQKRIEVIGNMMEDSEFLQQKK